jgi:hypothetical protein
MGSSKPQWQTATSQLRAARIAAGLPPEPGEISEVSAVVSEDARSVHARMSGASDRMASLLGRLRRAPVKSEAGAEHCRAIVEEIGRGVLSQAALIRDRRDLETLLAELDATIACVRET